MFFEPGIRLIHSIKKANYQSEKLLKEMVPANVLANSCNILRISVFMNNQSQKGWCKLYPLTHLWSSMAGYGWCMS